MEQSIKNQFQDFKTFQIDDVTFHCDKFARYADCHTCQEMMGLSWNAAKMPLDQNRSRDAGWLPVPISRKSHITIL